MDALSSLLQNLQPQGHIFFTGEYCGNFTVDTSGNGLAHFHVIARGQCWLRINEKIDPRPLQAGDLVLLPHDAPHALLPSAQGEIPDNSHEGYVSLICGYFEFNSNRVNPVLSALPEVVVLRADEHPEDGWLDLLLQFMKHEARREAPGMNMVIDRLSEVLFLFILRALIDNRDRSPEFLRAFADPAIARALGAIHSQPDKQWSLEQLADVAALSRTTFINRFRELVGITPASYLTKYRMDQASSLLRQGVCTMDEIAERCGYNSTAAFAKAYKKNTGVAPGTLRRGG
jgi:AraC-like DNA-binding protein